VATAKLIQFEILGRDGPALQRFYRDLFGWKFNTDNPGGYGMSSSDETGVVVGVGPARDGSGGHVTGYVLVPDIDQALAKATKLGGKVVLPKMSPGPGATIALVADPEGHVIGISQA
jgi:predicted enzyme related to lactoylglutathione lyase